MPTARSASVALALVALAVLAGCSGGSTTPAASPTGTPTNASCAAPPDQSPTSVALCDRNGTELATVSVVVADEARERSTGLSETDSLEPGQGMLFVHPESGEKAYVMRNMSFALDILFVDANGTITTIHHAGLEPGESGAELTHYRGNGTYVLEVPRGYANETGVAVGDRLGLPNSVA
jgi:uncharacterized membrane protein (UPF0127 family)